MKELHIYPCFDSLLYFPVYVALDTMEDNHTLVNADEHAGHKSGRTWQFPDFTVELHLPEPGGDIDAIKGLIKHPMSRDNVAVAICDPMMALLHNRRQLETEEPGSLKILGTFVDKVAIWGTAFRPKAGATDQAGFEKHKRLAKLWNKHEKHKRPTAADLAGCSVGYCQLGFTTAHYLAKEFNARVQQSASGGRDGYVLTAETGSSVTFVPLPDFGQREIESIFNNECDIVFTNTPWLAEVLREKNYDDLAGELLEMVYRFPATPYPFSSIVTTVEAGLCEGLDLGSTGVVTKDSRAGSAQQARKRDDCAAEFNRGPHGLISMLLRHMLMAIALTYRSPERVITRLSRIAPWFNHYGLSPSLSEPERIKIITRAVEAISFDDYLSEQLLSSWTSWNYALDINKGAKVESSVSFLKVWQVTASSEYLIRYRYDEACALNDTFGFVRDSFFDKVDNAQKSTAMPPSRKRDVAVPLSD